MFVIVPRPWLFKIRAVKNVLNKLKFDYNYPFSSKSFCFENLNLGDGKLTKKTHVVPDFRKILVKYSLGARFFLNLQPTLNRRLKPTAQDSEDY